MKLDFANQLDPGFSPGSRVWVYQSSRPFTIPEALEIEEQLLAFTSQWKSHGTPVKGAAYLFFGRFVVLMADEKASGVSGCSTDSSVRLIKAIEQQYQVNMFDRMALAFVIKDQLQLLPYSQLQYAFDNQFVSGDTLYFNNLVQTKQELTEGWIVPLKNSWLSSRISAAI